MVTLKYIQRAGEIYGTKESDGWWMLWITNPNKSFVGNFQSKEAMFEWINEAEKMKQHPSLKTRAPKRPLKDISVGAVPWFDEIEKVPYE